MLLLMEPGVTEKPILVVFCRRPRLGVGKQRVAADVGPDQALALSELLLACAIEDAMAWPGPVALAPSSPEDRAWAGTLLAGAAQVVPQPAGNLGERIVAVDGELRGRGYTRLIFIGSDAPTLTDSLYARARAALDGADVVLGPAEDGGVTLMGARVPWPALSDLPWSTPGLGAALARCCQSHHLAVQRLAMGYDVDATTVLPRLCADLATDARPARHALRQWLQAHGFAHRPGARMNSP